MSVNFTGIQDYKVYRKGYTKPGIYVDNEGQFRSGAKRYNETIITARLTDDKKGDHLTQYLMSLPESYQNQNGVDRVTLRLKKFEPLNNKNDAYLPNLVSSDEADAEILELNDKSLDIYCDKQLSLASFLAHLTKRDTDVAGLSDNQKKAALEINDVIHRQACNCLDIDV